MVFFTTLVGSNSVSIPTGPAPSNEEVFSTLPPAVVAAAILAAASLVRPELKSLPALKIAVGFLLSIARTRVAALPARARSGLLANTLAPVRISAKFSFLIPLSIFTPALAYSGLKPMP